MAAKLLAPILPGEILFEDFMKPLGLSINALAREIDVPLPADSGRRPVRYRQGRAIAAE
jgi:antitoxin HigA-1